LPKIAEIENRSLNSFKERKQAIGAEQTHLKHGGNEEAEEEGGMAFQ
jgi:hypothetical protein